MCMNPKVSIVIPVYNGEDYIREAIDSALSQTYENCEVIVVNDGSTDNTEAIVTSYGDKIRYFSKENGGVSSALNVGIDHMEGEYFQYLPHDDLLHPDKIEKNIQAIQQSGNEMSIVWSGWNFKYMDGRGSQPFQIPYQYNDKNRLTNSVFPLLFSILNTVTVLINKQYFDKIGKFNTELYTSQDYDMWYRTFIDQRTIYLEEELVDYRMHEQQGTQTDSKFEKNCISMSEFMVSNLSEKQILDMFGYKYRFFYYMLDFYKQQGWSENYKNVYLQFQNCSEPEDGSSERERLYQYLETFGYDGNNLVLYCAGKNAKYLLETLNVRCIPVKALSDRDKGKTGAAIHGIKCISPEDINPKKDMVIVTKDKPEDAVLFLHEKGIDHIVSYKEIGSTVYHALPIKQMYKDLKSLES
mgnify:CR=1 FL=1